MVNQEQLSLYYGIGRYVSEHSRKGYWGTGAIGTISKQLKSELPGLKGFSEENIKLMRRFYETWKDIETKAAVEREQSDAGIGSADREQARQNVNSVVGTTEITSFNALKRFANSVVKLPICKKMMSNNHDDVNLVIHFGYFGLNIHSILS
jgi:ERCC4-type nuclease